MVERTFKCNGNGRGDFMFTGSCVPVVGGWIDQRILSGNSRGLRVITGSVNKFVEWWKEE